MIHRCRWYFTIALKCIFTWIFPGTLSLSRTLFIFTLKLQRVFRASIHIVKQKWIKYRGKKERKRVSKPSPRNLARKPMKYRETSAKGCFSCHSPNAWDYLATTRPRYRRRCCNPAVFVVSRMVRRWFDCNIIKRRKGHVYAAQKLYNSVFM